MIKDNILQIQEHISSICRDLGRNSEEITLIGVTKYADAAKIQEAVDAGLTDIGENKVQEAKKKFPILENLKLDVTRHMIGHLQTNKVKQALEHFDLIQSVDSLKLAQEIDKQAAKINRQVDILVQVNTANEEQKYGLKSGETLGIIENILELKQIRIRGFMTIAPFTNDKNIVRDCFKDLKSLFDGVHQKFANDSRIEMKYLSMGMTDDYEIALEEGSNMVRIGRAIFSE